MTNALYFTTALLKTYSRITFLPNLSKVHRLRG
jgi:hypothetical protein